MDPDRFIDYLGVPFRAYHKHWHSDAPFEIDRRELDRVVHSIRSLCFTSRGTRVIHIPSIVNATHQLLYNKALYPTVVVDIDYKTLDSMVYEMYRILLQLPKCTPKALLLWELRIMPSRLQAYKRALRYIGRLVRYSPFYAMYMHRILIHRPPAALNALFLRGPLKRILTILAHKEGRGRTIGELVLPGLEDQYDAFRLIRNMDLADWNSKVNTAMSACFRDWVKAYVDKYPACYKQYLRIALDVDAGGKRPQYLSLAGDRARAGLRFKVPFLRYYHDREQPIPACAWCGAAAAECGYHLLQCPRQPDAIAAAVQGARDAVRNEGGRSVRTPQSLHNAMFRLRWSSSQTAQTTLHVLRIMTFIVNTYRRVVPSPPGRDNPISPIRTMALALCGRCGDQLGEQTDCACARRGVAKGKRGKKGSVAGEGDLVGVATLGKGRRGRKGSAVGNGTSAVGVATASTIVQHVVHVGVSSTHLSAHVGLQPP
eukprot:57113-Eustigmatos_ZCMA.PRE.1